MHNVTFLAQGLRLHPGHKYYFTVTAYNNVGLHTTVNSDGFVVDQHPPIAGLVYNTVRYRNYGMQSRTDKFEISWQGFLDHDSGIFTYLVAVFEDSDNATAVLNFTNVGLQTSVKFTNLKLQHVKSYYGAIKALDAAGHESITVYSKSKLIDTSPPKSYRCRDKTLMYDVEFNTSDSRPVIIPSTVESSSVYIITGTVRQPVKPVIVRTAVGQTFSKIVPSEKLHNGDMDFKTSFTPKANENVTFSIEVESSDTVAGTVMLYQCKVSPVGDDTDALHISQISANTFRARFAVQDPESGIKRVSTNMVSHHFLFSLQLCTVSADIGDIAFIRTTRAHYICKQAKSLASFTVLFSHIPHLQIIYFYVIILVFDDFTYGDSRLPWFTNTGKLAKGFLVFTHVLKLRHATSWH